MDLASGHTAALKQIFRENFFGVKIYNLGTGKGMTAHIFKRVQYIFNHLHPGVSVLEIVRAFEQVSGASIPIEIAPRRAGDLPSSYASCVLAEKELKWKSQFDLNDMCE